MKTFLFLASLLAVTSGLKAQQNQEPALVTVNGTHILQVEPDQAEIRFTVSSKEKLANEAQQANNAIVSKALAYLKKQGIAEKNFRTTQLTLNPYTEYISDKERKQLYMAQQAVTVKVEDLDKLGSLLSGLVEQGVNHIDQVEFKSSKRKELQAEARSKAVEDARAKAEVLAAALGQKVGKAYQVNDLTSEHDGGPRPMYRMEAAAADAMATPVAPGEISISAQVNVRFYLE